MKRSTATTVVIVLVCLTAVAVSWHAWTSSPTYALRQAARAVGEHDLVTFQKYVDVERVCERFVDDMMASVTEETGDNPFGGLAAGMIMMMRPRLVEAMQAAIERAIETGEMTAGGKDDVDAAGQVRPYWRTASDEESGFRRVAFVRKEGAVAIAGLEMFDADAQSSFTIELKLRDLGGHYQIVEIANLRETMAALREAEAKRLAELNAPIAQELARTVTFERLIGTTSSDRWDISRKAQVGVELRNRSNEPITKVSFRVRVMRGEEQIGEFRCVETERIEPGERTQGVWEKSVNLFRGEDKALYEGIDSAELVAEVTRVEFADGGVVELLESVRQASEGGADG